MNNQPTQDDEQLDWLAFQYVAGELSLAEATAFEERLAGDLSACEAVARAVELSDALHAAQQAIPHHLALPVRAERDSRAWSLMGIAAAVLIVGTLWMRQSHQSSSVDALAQQWSNQLTTSPLELAFDDIATNEIATNKIAENEAAANDMQSDEQPDEDELLIGADAVVPAWMLDGVRGLYDQDADRSAAQNEELES